MSLVTKSLVSLAMLVVSQGALAKFDKPLFFGRYELPYRTNTPAELTAPIAFKDIRGKLIAEGRQFLTDAAIIPQKASELSNAVANPARDSQFIIVAGQGREVATRSIDGWIASLYIEFENGQVARLSIDGQRKNFVILNEQTYKLVLNEGEAHSIAKVVAQRLNSLNRSGSPIKNVEMILSPYTMEPNKIVKVSPGSLFDAAANDTGPSFNHVKLGDLVFTGIDSVKSLFNASSSCNFLLTDFLVTGSLF